MQVTNRVTISLVGLSRYRGKIDQVNSGVYKKWAVRYRSFTQKRWDRFSKGGGDWAPLKSRRGSILRDTSTMFNTMAPIISAPAGSINKLIKDGIEVGFSGSQTHKSGKATIAQIAFWHQTGAGNNPERKIIVPPDANTLDAMRKDMQKAHDDAV